MNRVIFKCFILLTIWLLSFQPDRAQNSYNERILEKWMSLLPNLGITQYAGNIGFMSMGIGWDYGKNNQFETHFLLGYLPQFTFDDNAITLTLREQYNPWEVPASNQFSITPASFSLSLNALMNDEFWFTEPINNNYYRFSSKVRLHLGVGSRINTYIPNNRKRHLSRISLYYELSTYDLAVISYVRNRYIHLKEILSLGIGVNVNIF